MRDKWQPISTAPRDGTEVLTFSPTGGMRVDWARDDEKWQEWVGHPTHWMPLPERPHA